MLTVVGLALGVIGAVLFVVPQRSAGASESDADVEIVAQATKFAESFATYDSADPEGFQKRVLPLMTKEYGKRTETETSQLFPALADKKLKSADAKVKAVAVESSDSDSAKVLVVIDATATNSDVAQPTLMQMRWIVSMQKEGGQWLADAYQMVEAGVADAAGGQVPAPSATTPSSGAGQ